MYKVLAVDDEPNNLLILESFLDDAGYDVQRAENGQAAWNVLNEEACDFDVILLDRMMPVMNGMEFLKLVKSDKRFHHIPVIMQTAAAEKSQVLEGIEAGVYYYLTKPFEEEILVATVNAAVADFSQRNALAKEASILKGAENLILCADFEFSTVNESKSIATFVAALFPEPETTVFGIAEILLNAVEHGNLGITYGEKSALNIDKCWLEEVEKRLLLPEFKDKKVRVTYERHSDHLSLLIKDEGDGFEWQNYMEIDPSRATDNHGRGIALANLTSFDSIEYIGSGNEVLCKVNLSVAESS